VNKYWPAPTDLGSNPASFNNIQIMRQPQIRMGYPTSSNKKRKMQTIKLLLVSYQRSITGPLPAHLNWSSPAAQQHSSTKQYLENQWWSLTDVKLQCNGRSTGHDSTLYCSLRWHILPSIAVKNHTNRNCRAWWLEHQILTLQNC
jgi:hypothetical protein